MHISGPSRRPPKRCERHAENDQFLKCNLVVLVKWDSHVSSNRNGSQSNVLASMKWVPFAFALRLGVAFSVPLSVPALSDSPNTAMQIRTAPPLQRGDLVRLRSGGPLMTVDAPNGDKVDCLWTDLNGQINAESFPVHVLRKF
jgi:uncharacterized protein YodC (DUF2158 family)